MSIVCDLIVESDRNFDNLDRLDQKIPCDEVFVRKSTEPNRNDSVTEIRQGDEQANH